MFVSTKHFYACEGLELLWIITRDYWTRNAVLRRKITLYQEDDRDERKTEFFILQLIVQNDAEAREGFWEEPRAYISSFKFYQISSNGNKKFPLYIYILWKKTKKSAMTSILSLHYLFIRHVFYQGPITSANFSRVDLADEKTRLHGKFQPVLKLNVRAGIVVFYISCCT